MNNQLERAIRGMAHMMPSKQYTSSRSKTQGDNRQIQQLPGRIRKTSLGNPASGPGNAAGVQG
jgi:hypothetical protein